GADRGAAGGAESGGVVLVESRARELGRLPAHDVLVVPQNVLVGVVYVDQDSEFAVIEGVAQQAAEGRPRAAVQLVIRRRHEALGMRARIVERVRELDVDGRTHRAGGNAEVRRLVYVDLADVVRAHRAEIEGLTIARGNRPTLHQQLVELSPESTDGDAGSLSRSGPGAGGVRPIDGHAVEGDAGDAPDGLADGGVGELPDVLGRYCIDDAQ